MRIDSAGNVDIGTTLSPSASSSGASKSLVIATGSTGNGILQLTKTSATAGGCAISNDTGAGMIFYTHTGTVGSESYAERMRITSGGTGELIVGGTTATLSSGTRGSVIVNGSASALFQLNIGNVNQSYVGQDGSGMYTWNATNTPLSFATNNTERMRITSGGDVLIGTTSSSGKLTVADSSAQGTRVTQFVVPGTSNIFATYTVSGDSSNAAATAVKIGQNTSTSRSINAGGTVNASGADYAEYMVKAGDFIIAKGDICGVDSNGKLTNVFANAVTFVVKSTNPSYVGGDTWGTGLDENPDALEDARQTVDRIAFAGQVPVNVIGATAGQYIIPVNDNGAIKGIAVSNPTFEQYQIAVGKVIAIEANGRAKIIVKVC
jgi:hypothetical protein